MLANFRLISRVAAIAPSRSMMSFGLRSFSVQSKFLQESNNSEYPARSGYGGSGDRGSSFNRPARTPNPPNNTIYVGNMPWATSEEQIREKYETFGPLKRVFLPLERDTGRPRGFAYVEFATIEEAQSAIEATKDTDFNGRSLRLDFAPPRRSNDGYSNNRN